MADLLISTLIQGLIYALISFGVYITYSILDFPDLGVDGTFPLGAAVTAILLTRGVNAWLTLPISLAAGALAGLFTGFIHVRLKIRNLLAGIITMTALFSINLRIMGGKANQAINPDKYNLLVSLRNVKRLTLENPILVAIVFTVVVIALLYWFFGTELGSGIRATGANPNMSRAQGINVDRNKVFGLMLSNGIVALSSALYSQYQGFTDVNAGRGAIVIGLAAVIIGEVLFARLFHNFALKLFGVALGAVIYYIVIQAVLAMGLNPNYLKLLSAVVVAIFLSIPFWKNKYIRASVKTTKGVSNHA